MTVDYDKMLKAISVILSPTGIAIVISGIFSFGSPIGVGIFNPIYIFILGILLIGLFPIGAVVYERSKGKVSLEVPNKKERTHFLVLAIFFYVIGALVFYIVQCMIMVVICAAYITVTSTITAVNFKTKVSVHAAGAAGPLTAVVIIYGIWTVFVYSFVALVVWIRLKLGAHTPKELLAGTMIGIIITGLTLFTLLPVWSF
ncbi:MAG: hypothetical protein ACFE7E_07385 [Candidatus Hodarchaeota archaeon]